MVGENESENGGVYIYIHDIAVVEFCRREGTTDYHSGRSGGGDSASESRHRHRHFVGHFKVYNNVLFEEKCMHLCSRTWKGSFSDRHEIRQKAKRFFGNKRALTSLSWLSEDYGGLVSEIHDY